MNILFLGDIVTGGVLPFKDKTPISMDFARFLEKFDLRIATLETALGDDIPFDQVKMQGRGNIIYSPLNSAGLLTEMGINVVSLANNHVFDLGIEGFRSTIQYLHKHNILFTGAGKNINEAYKPIIIRHQDFTIAIIAACSYDASQVAYVPVATDTQYGIAPLDENYIYKHITELKKTHKYVIVLPHWGKEYTAFPLKESVRIAKKMINCGADLIVGSHTHMVQPKTKINGTEIYFSLGNGLFPDFYINTPRPIWYPDKNHTDLDSIPVTYNYPFPVTQPLRRNWTESSRIGLAVDAQIDSTSLSSCGRFTYLTKDNILTLKDSRFPTIKLSIIGHFALSPFYDGGKLLALIKRIIRKISKVPRIK